MRFSYFNRSDALTKPDVYVIGNPKEDGKISFEWRIRLFDNIGRLLRDILYEDHLNDIYRRHQERKHISTG